MSGRNKKQFGVWMDSQNAAVTGNDETESGLFTLLGQVENRDRTNNSNENAANNHEIALTQKYFREIAAMMPNVDEIHVTGTGQIQEQFIKFLAATPQYKNVVATESTSNKMSDEKFLDFIRNHYSS